jgi:arylsulfatase A-like enzyme
LKNNVLFLLIDCLRADRCYGREADDPYNTPFINYLLKKGSNFTQSISVASFTTPCVTSILTGLYPFTHGINWFYGKKLDPSIPTLAEILKKSGYNTCAMVTGPLNESLANDLGIDRGFDEYLYRKEYETIYSEFKNQLIKKLETMRKPWFLFLHLWELHYPIYLPENIEMKYKLSPYKYDKALSCLDHQLFSILKNLDLDETTIIYTADHGEQLPKKSESIQRNLLTFLPNMLKIPERERKKFWVFLIRNLQKYIPSLRKKQGHGFHLFDYLIRIPLIITGNGFPEGKNVTSQVSQVDILPTIIDAQGLSNKINIETHGTSLLENINNDFQSEKEAYIGPGGVWAEGGNIHQQEEWIEGLRTSKWKYISQYNKENPVELYDLQNDPNEYENLVYKRKDIVEKFKKKLKDMKMMKIKVDDASYTEEEEEIIIQRLKALGYLN